MSPLFSCLTLSLGALSLSCGNRLRLLTALRRSVTTVYGESLPCVHRAHFSSHLHCFCFAFQTAPKKKATTAKKAAPKKATTAKKAVAPKKATAKKATAKKAPAKKKTATKPKAAPKAKQ